MANDTKQLSDVELQDLAAQEAKWGKGVPGSKENPFVIKIDGVQHTATSLGNHLAALQKQADAAAKQAADAMVAQQKAEAERDAAKTKTVPEKPFKVEMARYSLDHEETYSGLRGALKGTVQITGGILGPFGAIHVRPCEWDYLLERKDQISAFVNENRVGLDKAWDHANSPEMKSLKAKERKAKAAARLAK